MTTFNVLRNATIRNSMLCRHDTNEGFFVVWEDDEDFKLYEEFSGLTTRLVWDRNYFAVATSGVCFVGPVSDQPPFDAGIFDTLLITYRVEVGFNQTVPTTGRIQFQTNDDPTYDEEKSVDFPINPNNAYNEYTVDLSQVKEWQGEIIRIRLYPFIDGGIGNIIHLKSLKAVSTSNFICDTNFNGPLCDKFSEYSHPCPWTGAGGSCSGTNIEDGIDIIEGVNDRLLININGYGEQAITLRPIRGARLNDIARDIEEKLSNIAIGGYSGNRVDVDLTKLKITADDTREASSTVRVSDTPAARTLGFFDDEGNDLATCTNGVQAASQFEPAGTVQLSKGEIATFYLPDPNVSKNFISLDPRGYAVQAGRLDFNLASTDVQLSFTGDTLIEFNHPFTNNGVITEVSYSGDATVDTKFVFFRPKADGSLEQFASVDLDPPAGTLANKVFTKTTEVRVRKGDLIGVYDGSINLGRVEQRPNVSYFRIDGETFDGNIIGTPEVEGRGEEGLNIFARGNDKQTTVVLDIDFSEPQLLEEITVNAKEDERTEEVKLSRALVGGINGGPFITGETGTDKDGSQAPAWDNLGALTDGVTQPFVDAETAQPSWFGTEFSPDDLYDQTNLALEFDYAKGIPVFLDINRVVIYFLAPSNIKYFRLDYPITTNDADTNRNWGPVASNYSSVKLDGKLLEPNDHPIYSNPIIPTAETFVDSYQILQYNKLDLEFEPVKARSIRYNVQNYGFEDDTTKVTLSNFTLALDPRILEFEAYAESKPVANISDNFSFESSPDGETFYLHTTVRDDGATSARYLIGYPVKSLRLRMKPQGLLELFNVQTTLSQSQTKIITNAPDSFVNMKFAKDDFTSFEKIKITNNGEETNNFFVDISPQKNPSERCILWNKLGDLQQTSQSELGPSPSFSKRDDFPLREFNYAHLAPGWVLDPFWMINVPIRSYVSYNDGAKWEARGSLISDYNPNTGIDSISPGPSIFVYLLVDLGQIYSIETIQQIVPSGFAQWVGPLYSNKNTADPNNLDVIDDFVGVKEQARWIRFRGISRTEEEPNSTISKMSFLRISLDPLDGINKDKLRWLPAPRLTDFVFGLLNTGSCGSGWQCGQPGFTNFYAVDLGKNYRITSLFTGPLLGDGFSSSTDIDFVFPNNVGSNSNITYSSSETVDPSNVIWGSLGDEPGDRSRWIFIRNAGNIVDEIGVHIEGNDRLLKPSLPTARWWTASLGEVYEDNSNFREGTHSIAIDYGTGQGPTVEEIETQQSWGIDHELAKKDQLKLWLYISDINQVDLSQGHIALGPNTTENNGGNSPLNGVVPDRDNYFQWNLSDMTEVLTSGWNEIFLPFTDNFRVGQPYFTRDDLFVQSPSDPSGHRRFRWFRINFAGKVGNSGFTINVDDPRIVRADFLPVQFGNGLYIAGEEYAKFPLSNVNVLEGTIEFFINSDWTKSPGCNTCDDPKDHTIFRLFNSDKFIIALLMTGEGMRVYFSDDTKEYFLTDNNSSLSILIDTPTHIAVTWDFFGHRGERGVTFWVNGQVSSTFNVSAIESKNWKPNSDAVLLFGAKAWEGVTIPYGSGANAIIDNLKVYNYAKTDFSHSLNNEGLEHIRPSDELIEVSSDGINFFGSEDRGTELPLLFQDIPSGGSFEFYVRNKEQEGDTSNNGQSRTAFIEVLKAISNAV